MEKDVAEDIMEVVKVVWARTDKNTSVHQAASRLAAKVGLHVLRNENCFVKPEGSRREIPALKKVCSCGWETQPHTNHREAAQEAHMHQVSNAVNYEVD